MLMCFLDYSLCLLQKILQTFTASVVKIHEPFPDAFLVTLTTICLLFMKNIFFILKTNFIVFM